MERITRAAKEEDKVFLMRVQPPGNEDSTAKILADAMSSNVSS
jgi:hypothetical protein